MSNLDSFIKSSRPPPQRVQESREITDRESTFAASIYRARSTAEVRACVKHLKQVVHAPNPASHEIAAWRCMMVKSGKTGLGGEDDFELHSGCEDDGENWAGARVLKVMQTEGVIDAVVVVSRWYGGVMLGPVRFTHIETCTREVCRVFKLKEDIEDCVSSLTTLDDILVGLRDDLAKIAAGSAIEPLGDPDRAASQKAPKKQDYTGLHTERDLAKAKRLVTARENAIRSVKLLIAKKEQKS